PVGAAGPIAGAGATVAGGALVPGWNRIALDRAGAADGLSLRWKGAGQGGSKSGTNEIVEVRVAASPIPTGGERRLHVSYPLHGECVDHQAYVRGFADLAPGASSAPAVALA